MWCCSVLQCRCGVAVCCSVDVVLQCVAVFPCLVDAVVAVDVVLQCVAVLMWCCSGGIERWRLARVT